jgi:hypothetical protein
MPPPMKAKFSGGEVLFKNVPKDKVELVREFLKKLEANKPVDMEQVVALPAPTGVLPDVSLGISKNSDGNYVIAVVKYNHESKEAAVEECIPAGNHKDIAKGKMKIVMHEKGII